MRRQNVIIFSSGKNLDVAQEIASQLSSDICAPIVWNKYFQTVYGPRYSTEKSYALFRFLTKKIPSFDFAIIVAGDDDVTFRNVASENKSDVLENLASGKTCDFVTTRDNVIFELGMCCMALGETRVILVRHKNVRLIDDLRGVNKDQVKRCGDDKKFHSVMLTTENIQIKAFEYDSNAAVANLIVPIQDYIKSKADDFAPVVVGAACSTASGYKTNFIQSLCFALDKLDNPENFISKDPNSNIRYENLKKRELIELHVLMPSPDAMLKHEDLLAKTRTFIAQNFYDKKQYHIVRDSIIKENNGRGISFAAKLCGGKLMIIDLPTTLLASYETAVNILNIDADEQKEEGQKIRFLTKELDLFNATLKKILPHDESGEFYFSLPNNNKYKIVIDEISFDDDVDRKNCPWLYE